VEKDIQLYEKCKNLVSYHAGRFKDYGYLEGNSPAFNRSREFEQAWKARRSKWLAFKSVANVLMDEDGFSISDPRDERVRSLDLFLPVFMPALLAL
jgi:hypothetical protein